MLQQIHRFMNELFHILSVSITKKKLTLFTMHTKLSKQFCNQVFLKRTNKKSHFKIAIGLIFKSFTFEMIKILTGDLVEKLETNNRKRYYQWNKSYIRKKRSCTQIWFHSTFIRAQPHRSHTNSITSHSYTLASFRSSM